MLLVEKKGFRGMLANCGGQIGKATQITAMQINQIDG